MLKAQEAAEAKRCGLEDKLKKRTDRWLDAYDTWLQVEKFDHKIDMGLFADKFREEYELLYHHQDNIAGYEEAVSAFDEYVEANPDFLSRFKRISWRCYLKRQGSSSFYVCFGGVDGESVISQIRKVVHMPRERFEPKKSAEYFAAYKDENEVYQTERIKFDAKKNQWVGTYPDEWYKERITSWWTVDGSSIM